MKLLAPDPSCKILTVNDGPDIPRSKDGTFHVDDATGRSIKRGGEFGVIGTTFRGLQGFECPSCRRENVVRDSCGKCGWHA